MTRRADSGTADDTATDGVLHLLAGPDRRSIGRSNEVVGRVLRAPRLLPELVRGLRAPDPAVRMRAADALEKVARHRPELLERHRSALLRAARTSDQPEVQWHMAQLLPRLGLRRSQRADASRALQRYLGSGSRIVQAMALEALVLLAPETAAGQVRVRRLLGQAVRSPFPAVRARARKLARQQDPVRGSRSARE